MESMSEPKKRIRKRAIAIQIQQCLDDAARATTADISTQKLIQVRLKTLTTMQARERSDKLKRAETDLKTAKVEIERLQELNRVTAKPRTLTVAEQALASYEATKNGGQNAS